MSQSHAPGAAEKTEPTPWIRADELGLPRRALALGFLLVAYFFYAWSWNTIDILRPYIKESLGLTLTESGSAYTLQSIGALVGAVAVSYTHLTLPTKRIV